MAWGKMFFTSVWHLFVSRSVLSFWLLHSLWQLGSLMVVMTISFELAMDLYESLCNSEKG